MRKQTRSKGTSRLILTAVAQGTVVTLAVLLSPASGYYLLRHYLKNKFNSDLTAKQTHDSLTYLKRKKFISYKRKKKGWRVTITPKGLKHLDALNINDLKIPSVAWDNRWRIVTFDVPEPQKPARQALRQKLKQMGFFHFQRSVFIIPYPCDQEINVLSGYYRISQHVHVITADRFDGDSGLIAHFHL